MPQHIVVKEYNKNYPFMYEKDIKALVYIMNEEVRDILRPSQTYFNTCLQGYKDFGFDDIYLYDAYNLIK